MAWVVFENQDFLFLLLSVPLLFLTHFITLKFVKRKALHFANFEAIERVTGKRLLQKNFTVLILRSLILILVILSASGPILKFYGTTSAYSFVLAIDASASMLADDFSPSRLEAAKSAAADFVGSENIAARIGIVSFSGSSSVLQQPTSDKALLLDKISSIEVLPAGGTDLGEAIITSSNLIIGDPRAKRVILLTDGRSTVGTPIESGINHALNNDVVVDTIGIGTDSGGSFANVDIKSRLDEKSLRLIADTTGGSFYKADSISSLKDAYNSIADVQREIVSQGLQVPLMIAALVLLFIEWGLINTRFRTYP